MKKEIFDITQVEFVDYYHSNEEKYTTLYFTCPKEWLNEYSSEEYPEAVFATISVEFPDSQPEAKWATVMMSPTMEEEDESYTDYDWFDTDLPNEHIEVLINLAKNSNR